MSLNLRFAWNMVQPERSWIFLIPLLQYSDPPLLLGFPFGEQIKFSLPGSSFTMSRLILIIRTLLCCKGPEG